MNRRQFLGQVTLPTVLLLSAACAAPAAPAPTAAPAAKPADAPKPAAPAATAAPAAKPTTTQDVTVYTNFLRNGEFVPLYISDVRGYFGEEGIKLNIIDGGPGKNPVPAVGAGQAQFGIFGLDNIVAARAAADPVDIIALGAQIQKFPLSYLTLTEKGAPAPKPKDMEGKTLGLQSAAGEVFLRSFAAKNNVDMSKIKIETVQAGAEPLLVGKVDFFQGFLTNQTYQIDQEIAKPDAPASLKNKQWQALVWAEWTQPSLGSVLFTTTRMTKDNPDLVKRFMRAYARGLKFYLDNQEESVRIVAAYPQQIEDAAKLTWRFKVQSPLFTSPDTDANGLMWMNPTTWENMIKLLVDNNVIARTVPVTEVMTNEFLPGKDVRA